MMEEIISLARECIGEMLKMSPDEIEAFRQDWLQRLDSKQNAENFSKVRQFVNDTCDCALNQVMQKTA